LRFAGKSLFQPHLSLNANTWITPYTLPYYGLHRGIIQCVQIFEFGTITGGCIVLYRTVLYYGGGDANGYTIPHTEFHRGHTTPVNAWGAIGYGYKSAPIFVDGTGKKGAFKQVDYLTQVLECLQLILEAFALITHQLRPAVEPLFMEDGTSAHGHKSTSNCCARYRTKHGIILMPHPSTNLDMNPIEKCWRWIKQALHRRQHQPTTKAEMRQAVLEEWEAKLYHKNG
jgi:transposase